MNLLLRVQKPALSLLASPSTYPLTTFWLGSMAVLFADSKGWISLSTAFVILGFLALLLILLAFRKDIAAVHVLVNSKSDEQIERIEQLIEKLQESGIEVPKSKGGNP